MNTAPQYREYVPPPEVQAKLELSVKEAEGLKERTIYCPACHFRIDGIFEDCTGHRRIWCRKCKKFYIINLAYFRLQKSHRKSVYAFCFRKRQRR